jgi:peptidoglycan/xylan/chitin deacetylase (PgdA/CDA1 family)
MAVGTHGMDHRPWVGLDEATRRRELVEARDRLREVVGQPVDEAALPLGRYDRKLLGHLRALGYRRVHTSDRAWARPGGWLQPRFSVRDTDTADSLGREVLTRPSPGRRAERAAAQLVKRWR